MQPAWVEMDVNRPGSDFKVLWLRAGLEACQEACAQNPLCKSYTYVRAGDVDRIEGCWLKDAVSPPVKDGCCVSGVKTGETVSRFLREPVITRKGTEPVPEPPMEREAVLRPSVREPEIRVEELPRTGSGERRVAGMDFAAIPPEKAVEEFRTGLVSAVFSPAAQVGTGRRQTRGMDFTAVPPGIAPVPIPEPVRAGARETGTGRRRIRGATFAAAPPPEGESAAKDGRGGPVVRNIDGVDIKAVPPQR